MKAGAVKAGAAGLRKGKESNMWNLEQFRRDLAAIVNIDSGSENFAGIGKVAHFLKDRLKAEGFFVELSDRDTRLQAQSHREGDFDILMAGHMDTVFPDGTAAVRPYSEKDGMAYGPGAADMKAGLLLAVNIAAQLKQDRPDLKLCLAFNSDEEIGSARSKDWLQDLARRAGYAFVFEPGRNGTAFVRSRKGCADLVVKFHGIAAHAGVAPEKGANAIVEMARWITALTEAQNLNIGTSVSVGVVSGGTGSNVVPAEAELKADIRVKIPEELQRIKAVAEKLENTISVAGVTAEARFLHEMPPMNPSEATERLMTLMNETAKGLNYEISWADTGGVSDANHIADLGIPTICGCGPCGGNLHSEAEFLELSSIEKRLNLMYQLCMKL